MVRESVVREWSRSKFRFNDEKTSLQSEQILLSNYSCAAAKASTALRKWGDMVFEHPQNTHLCAIIQANLSLTELFRTPPTVPEPPEVRASRAVRAWLVIQGGVNRLMDATKADRIQDRVGIGIRQQLEKKQGLFRMNMMGKRVNYAARSVISPDPYLGTGEIGRTACFCQNLNVS